MSHPTSDLLAEINKRRTFAIISHPDAGKTTLTEKLLLYGGAIHTAGAVKASKASRHATSDWMELEKQRGISVTTSVMQFPYKGHELNLLDTPGHQDFSEDTYRTLAAVDSAVMLIDCVKGVETQTKKLFTVCRMRGIPIFTFINKLDRNGQDPLELMEEIETVLGIRTTPLNWPIGMGSDFRGIYERRSEEVVLFENTRHGTKEGSVQRLSLSDETLPQVIGQSHYDKLLEDIEMLDIAGDPFDAERVARGELSPMYFGSAMTNFGVEPFLDSFVGLAPKPASKPTAEGERHPNDPRFSGFIFKIQANMNPAHRDCVAFMRIVSGKFVRGMNVRHARLGRDVRLAKSLQFMAQDRALVEEAFPGDVVGLFDPGFLRIGDTLCEGQTIEFQGIPRFTPEIFATISLKDPSKRKQFKKGLDQLIEEGAVQLFFRPSVGEQEPILGAVGRLQFDVFSHRLKAEYSVDVVFRELPFETARWVVGTVQDIPKLEHFGDNMFLHDRDGRAMLLFRNPLALRWEAERHPDLRFLENLDDAIAGPRMPHAH
ncbi:MAG: peptide chain release factor 3 [Candidatus Sericytochromatia bacterium]|nr:peptide chain release factor 3 [Candidatus Sericytochromatia bacterium]